MYSPCVLPESRCIGSLFDQIAIAPELTASTTYASSLCAASRNQLHEPGAAVVIADVEYKRQSGLAVPLADGEAQHLNNIPKPSGLVLAGDIRRHDHVSVKDAAREKNW
jgi:hypothetical protein